MPPVRNKPKSAPAGKAGTPSSAGTSSAGASTSELTPAEKKLAKELLPAYTMLGGGLEVFGLKSRDTGLLGVADVIESQALEICEQWVMLARRNELVKTWLPKIASSFAAGGLLTLHVMMVLPIVSNRGFIPAWMNPMPQYGPQETHPKITQMDEALEAMASAMAGMAGTSE